MWGGNAWEIKLTQDRDQNDDGLLHNAKLVLKGNPLKEIPWELKANQH